MAEVKTTVKRAPSKTGAAKKVTKTAVKSASPQVGKAAPKAPKKAEKAESFAVIETGGKQYTVAEGDTVEIEKLPGTHKEGGKISFDKVLLVDDGKDTSIGDPYIKGAKVEGKLVEEGRGKKISVIRFRAKSRHFKKKGHRQPYMKVRITALK